MIIRGVIRNIIRNKGQSLLLIVISFLFTCFMGLYLGSIVHNKALLNTLGERLPVKAALVDAASGKEMGLKITEKQADNFMELSLSDYILTAECYGNFKTGDTEKRASLYINAVNDISALMLQEDRISMEAAEVNKILKGNKNLCFFDKDYLEQREAHIEIGDTLEIPLFQPIYDDLGFVGSFAAAGEASVKVAGFYRGTQGEVTANFPNMICPAAWLREQYEARGTRLTYTSAKANVKNPLELNQLKKKAKELKFKALDSSSFQAKAGIALAVDDHLFIQSATEIRQNIRLLEFFQFPVMLLLILLEALVSFMMMKRHVYELYLLRCLGEKKYVSITKLILEILFLSFAGSILACILLSGIGYVGWTDSLLILLKFLFVSLLGASVPGILFAWVNPMKLFQQVS